MPSQNPGIFRDFAEKQYVNFVEIDLHAGEKIPDLKNILTYKKCSTNRLYVYYKAAI